MTFSTRLRFCLAVLVALLLLVALTPTLISTQIGKNLLIARINHRLPGTLAVEELSLSWFGTQSLKGIIFRDSNGIASISVEDLTIFSDLISILRQKIPHLKASGVDGTFIEEDGTALRLSKLELIVAEPREETLYFSSLSSKTDRSNDPDGSGEFTVSLFHRCPNPLSFITHKKGLINLKLVQFPVGLIDVIASLVNGNTPPIFSTLFGDILNMSLTHTKFPENETFQIIGKSAVMKMEAMGSIKKGILQVHPGGYFSSQLPPSAANHLMLRLFPRNDYLFTEALDAHFEISSLQLPLAFFQDEALDINPNQLSIESAFSLGKTRLEGLKGHRGFNLDHFRAKICANDQSGTIHFGLEAGAKEESLPFTVKIDGTTLKPVHLRTFGSTLSRQTNILLDADHFSQFMSFLTGKTTMGTPPADTDDTLTGDVAFLDGDLIAQAKLSTFATNTLLFSKEGVSLESPLETKIKMEKWNSDAPRYVKIGLDCGITNVKVKGRYDFYNGFVLTNPIASTIRLTPELFKSLKPESLSTATLLEPCLVNLLIDEPKGKIHFHQLNRCYLSGFVEIPKIAISFAENNEPVEFHNMLVPWELNGYANQLKLDFSSYVQSLDSSLSAVLDGKFGIKNWFVEDRPFFSQAKLEGNIDLSCRNLKIIDKERDKQYYFPEVVGTVSTTNLAETLQFNINAHEMIEGSNVGRIHVRGSINNIAALISSGNADNISFHLNSSLHHIPVALFCKFLQFKPSLDKQIEAVLGSIISSQINVSVKNMNGPVYADISGQNGEMHIDGFLEKGMLKLKNPLNAKMLITKELRDHILKKISPAFKSVLPSDQLISLSIDPNKFSVPVYPFELSNVQIGYGVVNLDKLQLQNKGSIASFLKLLNDPNKNQLTLWTTPCYFNVTNGVVGIARVDMLIGERYPIAVWGKLDLPADKVNMVVGLSGTTIGKAFNIAGLKGDVMVTLPVKGTLGKAGIDRRKAVAKLASAAAKKDGDAKGLLIGTVLDIATGNILDSSAPPPTTQPFPWADIMIEE